jgi:glycosyltransferase involved in cell wall biosynthesis
VGRLVPVKGHAKLIEAVAELRRRGVPVHATLVGGGPRREALERLAARLGVAESVTFTGSLSHDDVLERYAEADVFCLPSFGEGLPVVLMEAMAMELPVVASQVMGVSELVEHDVSGLLVTPARPDLLADALERLASDPALRASMGAAGRKKVLAAHDVRRSARSLSEIYRGLGVGLVEPEPQGQL